MPIVIAYCRVLDGLGKPEQHPQVFLKVNGNMYRTHVHLEEVTRCEGGWTGSIIHYRGKITEKSYDELRKVAKAMIDIPPSKELALDPSGLKHCGIRFLF